MPTDSVGDYRIPYALVSEDEVLVFKIARRETAYDWTIGNVFPTRHQRDPVGLPRKVHDQADFSTQALLRGMVVMNSSHAVEIESVVKRFGDTRAVYEVSLNVDHGEVFGLLGPNGSGKSTLMKMMLGLLKPDDGSITVGGFDVQRNPIDVRRIVGYVPESPRLYEFLTCLEYLDFVADLYKLNAQTKRERITEFLKAFELEGRENEMLSGYSQGMRQKAAIIAALLHKPKLLILDEPLNGLDPRSAKILKDLIHKLADEGVSTVFSTHVLEIAEAICTRVAIMHEGQVLAQGSVAELRSKAGMPGSTLEELFLKLTGTGDVREIVEALLR